MHNKSLKKGQNHLVYLNVCSPSFSQKTIREKVRSELPRLMQPELASWECSPSTGHHTQKGPALGLLLCCHHIEILSIS